MSPESWTAERCKPQKLSIAQLKVWLELLSFFMLRRGSPTRGVEGRSPRRDQNQGPSPSKATPRQSLVARTRGALPSCTGTKPGFLALSSSSLSGVGGAYHAGSPFGDANTPGIPADPVWCPAAATRGRPQSTRRPCTSGSDNSNAGALDDVMMQAMWGPAETHEKSRKTGPRTGGRLRRGVGGREVGRQGGGEAGGVRWSGDGGRLIVVS